MKNEFESLLRSDLLRAITANNELTVKETDPSAKLKELTIRRIPKDSVAFELDHKPSAALKEKLGNAFNQLSCLINESHPEANKACDLVIVSLDAGRPKVVIAELKSKKPDKKKCEKQLWNSKLFLDYLFVLLSEYHGVKTKPDYRLVAFRVGRPNISKALTQQKNRPHRGNQEAYTFQVNGPKAIISYGDFA